MSSFFIKHHERIEAGANNVYNLHNLSKFVEKNVRLFQKPYVFGDKYGFQAHIIDDTARVTNTVKPAQIGMSIATMAYVISGCATQPKFDAIYALPSSNDAAKLVAQKMNPLIQDSPEVWRLVDKDLNNNEMKRIGKNFLFIRGTKSETAALSISADALVADEVDRCDPDTLLQFRSRLQASELQVVKQFSTPTIVGVGIEKAAQTSKRMRNFATCIHCGHSWLPSYHLDIRIPGFTGDLVEINKNTLKDVQWQRAHWHCPACGKDPQLHPSRLQWVCENPTDNYEANTWFITPVTACLALPPHYLVRTSTEFAKRSEWQNQVLGECAEDQNEQITESDVTKAYFEGSLDSSEVHVLGADMGLLCAISIGRMTKEGQLLVVHREMVPLGNFLTRRAELIRQYKCVASVHDTFPYVNTITDLTVNDPNAYGCQFIRTKSTEIYILKEREENNEDGKLNLRLLNTNRTLLLDKIMELFKSGLIVLRKQEQNWETQYTSLKRTQVFISDELSYEWQKTDGEDHMMFSLGYLYLATQMRGRLAWSTAGAVPFVKSFKVAQRT